MSPGQEHDLLALPYKRDFYLDLYNTLKLDWISSMYHTHLLEIDTSLINVQGI